MADYDEEINHHNQTFIPKETALQALNNHNPAPFRENLKKRRAIDHQKKKLHKIFQLFFIFLGLATHKLRFIKSRNAAGDFLGGGGAEDEVSASAAAIVDPWVKNHTDFGDLRPFLRI